MKRKFFLTPDLKFSFNKIKLTDEKKSFDTKNIPSTFSQKQNPLGPCKRASLFAFVRQKHMNIICIIEAFDLFEHISGVFVTSSLNRKDDKSQVETPFMDTKSHSATILTGTNSSSHHTAYTYTIKFHSTV